MKYELIKQLQCLYSWAEFYSKNENWDKMDICQEQITAFKKKRNLE